MQWRQMLIIEDDVVKLEGFSHIHYQIERMNFEWISPNSKLNLTLQSPKKYIQKYNVIQVEINFVEYENFRN